MLSRGTYKGCKIEFTRDECDVPLPTRALMPRAPTRAPPPKMKTVANRFGMLNLDGTEDGSDDEQPSSPRDQSTTGGYADAEGKGHFGVSLRFLDDAESTV